MENNNSRGESEEEHAMGERGKQEQAHKTRASLQIPIVEDTPRHVASQGSDLCKLQPVSQEEGEEEEEHSEGEEEESYHPEDGSHEYGDYQNRDKDSSSGFRIFLGGLTGTTTSEDLSSYFANLASIIEAVVVTDPNTKKPSGFGFLTVCSQQDMEKILKIRHTINGSNIDCKAALTKSEARNKEVEERKRKLFVGGLPKNLSDETLHDYFSKFGKIQKAYVVKDFKNGSTRGFGFVIFETVEGYDSAFSHQGGHHLLGKEIFVRETNSRKEEKQKKSTIDESGLILDSGNVGDSSRILSQLNDSRIHNPPYSTYPAPYPGYPEYPPYYPPHDPYAHLHHPSYLHRGFGMYPPGNIPYPYEDPYYSSPHRLVPIPGYQISYQPVYKPIYPSTHHPGAHPLYSPQLTRHPLAPKVGAYPSIPGNPEHASHQIYHPYYHPTDPMHPTYLPPSYPPGYPMPPHPDVGKPNNSAPHQSPASGGKNRNPKNNIGKITTPSGIGSMEVTPISKKTISPQSAINKAYNYPLVSPVATAPPKPAATDGNFTKLASPMLVPPGAKPLKKLQQIESKYAPGGSGKPAPKGKRDFVSSSKSPVEARAPVKHTANQAATAPQ